MERSDKTEGEGDLRGSFERDGVQLAKNGDQGGKTGTTKSTITSFEGKKAP